MLRRIKNDKTPPQEDAPSSSPATGVGDIKSPLGRLGEILVEEKIITASQLEEGLAMRKKTGGFLGQALIELGYLDQDTLNLVLVKQCKIPHLNLLDYTISQDMVNLIPKELCQRHSVLPVDKMGKILTVAMVDPLNAEALEAVRMAFPELRVKPILCDWPHFQEVFQKCFPGAAKQPSETPPAPTPEKPAPQQPVKQAAPVAAEAPEKPKQEVPAPNPPRSAPAATASASSAPAFDYDALKAAIQDGVRQSVATIESRIAEASELLQQVRETERGMVESQTRRDLGMKDGDTGDGAAPIVSADPIGATPAGSPMTFDSFIVGERNTPVLQMAKAVAETPGGEQNPFFVCGDVGLGKTHLITAIGNTMKSAHGDMSIGWTSAGRFADLALSASRDGHQEEFRRAFDQWDALILDDIQFLGGRVEAQEELFHIFNEMQARGKQVVIAGDRAPDKLGLLEKRLVSRFDSGIVAFVHAPEWETRVRILRHYAKTTNVQVPDDVLAMIAMRYPDDVRRLIGSLRKVIARSKSNGGELSAELASEILAENGAEVAA